MFETYSMLFNEVRHALVAIREQRFLDAEHTLEDILTVERFIRNYRRRDPSALRMAQVLRRLEWEWTPEGRLEWERWREWGRSPEWLREQERLREVRDANSAIEPSAGL